MLVVFCKIYFLRRNFVDNMRCYHSPSFSCQLWATILQNVDRIAYILYIYMNMYMQEI